VGASWVRKNILEKYPDAPLSVYAVWVTQLGAGRGDVDAELFGDERVRSYWDPDGLVGEAIADDVESYGSVVWDVYALYGADARWEGRPTGLRDWGAPVIADSDRLGQRVEALLAA
jgi:hypothetical protein